VIAQINEDEAAMVTPAMNPAGNAHRRANMGRAQGAAGMGAIAMHGNVTLKGG
jgi:hypothetical protein